MTDATTRKTFVLVHGAGHGGWLWRPVRERLAARGHRVFTPTLTGLADRSHLLSAEVRLGTHIADVVNLFLWEDLADVVLVGHSYAGWVISCAVEEIGERVSALVYLDAFLPDDGQRGMDLLNAQQTEAFETARAKGGVSRPGPTAAALRIQSPENAAWVDGKITPQPIGVSLDPIRLTGARERIATKLYVRTPLFPQPRFDAALARCAADPGWRTAVMEGCGHDPMVDDPEGVVALLEGLQ